MSGDLDVGVPRQKCVGSRQVPKKERSSQQRKGGSTKQTLILSNYFMGHQHSGLDHDIGYRNHVLITHAVI